MASTDSASDFMTTKQHNVPAHVILTSATPPVEETNKENKRAHVTLYDSPPRPRRSRKSAVSLPPPSSLIGGSGVSKNANPLAQSVSMPSSLNNYPSDDFDFNLGQDGTTAKPPSPGSESLSEEGEKISPLSKIAPVDLTGSIPGTTLSKSTSAPVVSGRKRSESLSKRRKSAQFLQPLNIPDSTWTRSISKVENLDLTSYQIDKTIRNEGCYLFGEFVLSELIRSGFDRDDIREYLCTVSAMCDAPNAEFLKEKVLKLLVDFDHTPQRFMVKKRAALIDLQDIMSDKLFKIFNDIFDNGKHVNAERVLVLFFLCADLGARALREVSRDLFMNIMDWCVTFVKEKVSKWISRLGSWDAVFRGSIDFNIALGLGITATFIGIAVGIYALKSRV